MLYCSLVDNWFKNSCSLLIIPIALPLSVFPVNAEFLDFDLCNPTFQFSSGRNKLRHARSLIFIVGMGISNNSRGLVENNSMIFSRLNSGKQVLTTEKAVSNP